MTFLSPFRLSWWIFRFADCAHFHNFEKKPKQISPLRDSQLIYRHFRLGSFPLVSPESTTCHEMPYIISGFFLLLLVSPVQYVFIGLVLEMPNTRHHEQCQVYCGIALSTGLISLYLYKEIVTTPEIVTHFHTGSETRLNNLSNNPSNSKL